MITGEVAYEGIKGGKTGYTDEARQTLVTCAERNGMKLICVVMKEESPDQFYDTVKLFDYGFGNFSVVNVAENETKYSIQNSNFFNTSNDVFGNSNPILSLNSDSYLIVPKTTTFDQLNSEISYDTEKENEVAKIDYYYHGAYLGTATIDLTKEVPATYEFTKNNPNNLIADTTEKNIIIVNIKIVLIVILVIASLLIFIFVIHSIISNYNFLDGKRNRRRRKIFKKNRKKGPHFPSSRFNGFDL